MRMYEPSRGAGRHSIRAALALAVVAALSVSGCMTVSLDTGSIREPVSMTAEVNRDYEVVRHFERPLRGWFTLFDLVTVQNPKVEEIIRQELERSRGDGVVNLVIQGQDTFVDRLIPVGLSVLGTALASYGSVSYSLGTTAIGALITIASSQIRIRTYTVQGDVIRYRG